MNLSLTFFLNSAFLGIGLAMDAFSVSLANGLNDTKMKKGRMSMMAGVFSVFQFAMPMIGWICVKTVAQYFSFFEKLIPWIALILLCYIGGKMLVEGIKNNGEEEKAATNFAGLLLQGVATSIDALSVGFTIADHNLAQALLSCFIIGFVTFFICFEGLVIGKKAGTRLAGKAGIFGGAILIFIGIEIFVSNIF